MLNFADENTISAAENTIEKLIFTLDLDSQAAIDLFKVNKIILNPGKSQAIVVKKNCRMKDSYAVNIKKRTINSENCLKLLGIEIDNALSFDKHISNHCRKASNQLNARGRIQKYTGFKEKEVILNSFVLSNFNYCPLIWHFRSSKSLKKIEKIQERALRILYNDSTRDYNQFLNKSSKASTEVKRLRNLALEIFKTLNDLNPKYMKEIFYKTTNLTHKPFNIKVNQNNTTRYGNKSLRSLGFISGIPCQSRLKKKPITISLKIILINGLVQNINAIYVLI